LSGGLRGFNWASIKHHKNHNKWKNLFIVEYS
jgi:hypothetical protein